MDSSIRGSRRMKISAGSYRGDIRNLDGECCASAYVFRIDAKVQVCAGITLMYHCQGG